MIILESNHPVVEETVLLKLRHCRENPGTKPDAIGLTVADFDGVQYRLANPVVYSSSDATSADGTKHKEHADRTKLIVSLQLGCYQELRESCNAASHLQSIYGPMWMETPEKGFDVSLQLDLTETAKLAESEAAEVAKRISLLKRNCFAALFKTFFDHQEELAKEMSTTKNDGRKADDLVKRAVVHYRRDEALFVEARYDRVTVIFSLSFRDEDDVVIGKIFLQEFKEGRRASATAPQVLFSRDPPSGFPESKSTSVAAASDHEVSSLASSSSNQVDCAGYITFVLFPRHTTGEDIRENTIDLIHTFRNYLHYHIKCSKAYMHSRMRAKTSEFLKVLNRAKPDAIARGSVGSMSANQLAATLQAASIVTDGGARSNGHC